MKKILSVLITLVFAMSFVTGCSAAETTDFTLTMQIGNPTMTVNGTEKPIDAEGSTPVIINDRTLLPIRAVVEEMGGNVSWNGDTQEVTLNYNEDTIRLIIDNTVAYLNDKANTLDSAPTIINGRTMLPVRFIAESFGFDVNWNGGEQVITVSKGTNIATDNNNQKILVAYFTVPETDDVDTSARASRVANDGEVLGNVEFIAQTIQEQTGGDIFAIETVQQYPGTHDELLAFAAAEQERNEHPKLKNKIDNIDDYDVIFLGFPIWNADLPMPMYSFLDEYDLSGKTIIPFTAHGGSGFAGTIDTIAQQEKNAKVETNGFSVSRNSVAEAKNDIISWVQALGFIKADTNNTTDSNILVAYFSQTGNTQEVAEYISEQTGGELFRIEAKEPYTGDTQAVADRAKAEGEQNARPEVQNTVSNMEQYDTVFIGYPIWYYNAPMIIGTFLESYDLTGKTVIPFCTSSSSNIDVSTDFINNASSGATVLEGLTANGGHDEIDSWLDKLNIK